MKVSVIVPIYNVEKYLMRCLTSLTKQKFDSYEVIMVNDGTKDFSGEIAKGFAEKFSNFVYLEKENGGLGSARNYGIPYAQGEYLAFVDSDDWVNEYYVKMLYEACVTNNADISICGADRVWDDGTHKKFNVGFSRDEVMTDTIDAMLRSSYVAWNKMYKKELFQGVFYPEEKMTYEDYACTPRLFYKAKRIVYIDRVLYYYFWRSTSIINSNKIDRNILKAQSILEGSELSKCEKVLSAYYVRNVLGTLVWEMLVEGNHLEEVENIFLDALERYPNLKYNNHFKRMKIWQTFCYKLMFSGKFRLAELYAKMVNRLWKVGRFVYKRIH